jgi:hypothetical protein
VSTVDPRPQSLAATIVATLEPLLGPHTSRRALDIVCQRLGRTEESLGPDDAQRAGDILLPILRTLLGREAAERIRERIVGANGSEAPG